MQREKRHFTSEVRATGGGKYIEGYAVLWDSLSEDLGGFRERWRRGAFKESIAEDDIRVIWQHSSSHVFGRIMAGTAEIREDDKGLWFRATVPNATWAKDAVESIRRGDITQNSFGFYDAKDDWSQAEGGHIRTVKRARLIEVGPQTMPAFPDTIVSARARQMAKGGTGLEDYRRRLAALGGKTGKAKPPAVPLSRRLGITPTMTAAEERMRYERHFAALIEAGKPKSQPTPRADRTAPIDSGGGYQRPDPSEVRRRIEETHEAAKWRYGLPPMREGSVRHDPYGARDGNAVRRELEEIKERALWNGAPPSYRGGF